MLDVQFFKCCVLGNMIYIHMHCLISWRDKRLKGSNAPWIKFHITSKGPAKYRWCAEYARLTFRNSNQIMPKENRKKLDIFLFDASISCISYFADKKKKWLKTLSQTCNYAETQTTPKRVRFSPSSEQLFFLHFSKEKKINTVIFLFIFLWRVDLIELRKEKEKGYENDADGFLSGSGRQNQ